MSELKIVTKNDRLDTAVEEISKLCLSVKFNVLALAKKIHTYDNQFKDDELKFELERRNIIKGTAYSEFKKIGSKNILHNPKYQNRLPNGPSVLGQLAFFRDDVIRKFLDNGKINASMTVDEAKELKSDSGNTTKKSDLVKTVLSLTCKKSVYNKNKEKLKKLKRHIEFEYSFLNINGKID